MIRAAIAALVVAAMLAMPAAATESTIDPGVGIGKVKLGMTLTQVKHVLGPGGIVNERRMINGSEYLELGWNFSAWAVGFLRRGPTYRVVHVTTALHGQRTATGIGPGTFWLKLVKAYPGGVCTLGEYLVPHRGGTQTIFFLKAWPPRSGSYGVTAKTLWVVSVMVRTPYEPRPEFAPDYAYRCREGWQSTPLPRPKYP